MSTSVSVRRDPIDLEAIAQDALRRYDGQARDFGVTLEAESAAEARAIGDADRTLQIVSNLVENALRTTPAGGSVRIVTAPGSIRVENAFLSGTLVTAIRFADGVELDIPTVLQSFLASQGTVGNDLITGSWYASGVVNERQQHYKIVPRRPDSFFTPEAMAGEGVR